MSKVDMTQKSLFKGKEFLNFHFCAFPEEKEKFDQSMDCCQFLTA